MHRSGIHLPFTHKAGRAACQKAMRGPGPRPILPPCPGQARGRPDWQEHRGAVRRLKPVKTQALPHPDTTDSTAGPRANPDPDQETTVPSPR